MAFPEIALAIALLTGADGATDHERVAQALDAIRGRGRDAAAAEALASLLPHQSKLYANRDKSDVVRLRAYVVATLADVGVPDAALPPLLEIVATIDERTSPLEVGAAMRAIGTLGDRGRPFIPYLTEALTMERVDLLDFSLERYEPLFPENEATTVRLEAMRALGRLCTAGDAGAIAGIEALTGDADPRVAGEAARTVKKIRRSS